MSSHTNLINPAVFPP
ncbi:hypothetical protein LEMLEM_LOCUS7094 [Lemmus lemmus]